MSTHTRRVGAVLALVCLCLAPWALEAAVTPGIEVDGNYIDDDPIDPYEDWHPNHAPMADPTSNHDDTLCGTKVLWKRDYTLITQNRSYFGNFDPFGDFDLLFGASKLNLRILEMPIRYRSRQYGETNISRWRHGWLLLKMVIFAAKRIKFI